jgi:hypothetical protein
LLSFASACSAMMRQDVIYNDILSPTACVTRGWAGRDGATLTESVSSHTNCLRNAQIPTCRLHAVLGALSV